MDLDPDPDLYLDPDPYWSPTSNSGTGSVKNEYGSTTLVFIQSEVPITATDAAVDQVVKLLKELEPLCPSKVR